MTASSALAPIPYVSNIRSSGLTIYDPIEIGDPKLWIPSPDLERLLDGGLRALSLAGLPIRSRSKVAKEHVCRVLGYPIPGSFRKSQPRFPGQIFDTYVQKSNNLQIWNEELSPTRRYVLIRLSSDDVVTRVKVVTGDTLAEMDTTGTLTQKYQARCIPGAANAELVASEDTALLRPFVAVEIDLQHVATPISYPTAGALLPIGTLYARLAVLIDSTFIDSGHDQERNRGAGLHRMVCSALGYASYQDDGQFPDLRHQLLEVKLQTSPTIDLGLVLPSSTEPLDVPHIAGRQVRHCEVRYAIFYAHTDGELVTLTHLFLTTGEAFFTRFSQFQGRVLNKKLQIPLPGDFFDRNAEGFPD
ncbi:putative Type II restriction endonuclease [Candidatus Accumulibacter aalborgensis]|uniref:Putative Type II restriction endonuclease n=1 Tax=Candidatus Accumulibacter aalborgensis TaxID=1860102 RepID=A0A1A8XU88_9PROT|nr:restriction endonuclease [Candidatus Accumulibacter aalborgensis]SBT08117.1 putative Type II restriction endonuclease [Candidatus Accumulibacter aalborgensis]